MIPNRQAQAEALKACLVQLTQEALDHGFRMAALHLNVAVLELDDVIETEQLRARLLASDASDRDLPSQGAVPR